MPNIIFNIPLYIILAWSCINSTILNNEHIYAFPPFSLTPMVIKKILDIDPERRSHMPNSGYSLPDFFVPQILFLVTLAFKNDMMTSACFSVDSFVPDWCRGRITIKRRLPGKSCLILQLSFIVFPRIRLVTLKISRMEEVLPFNRFVR